MKNVPILCNSVSLSVVEVVAAATAVRVQIRPIRSKGWTFDLRHIINVIGYVIAYNKVYCFLIKPPYQRWYYHCIYPTSNTNTIIKPLKRPPSPWPWNVRHYRFELSMGRAVKQMSHIWHCNRLIFPVSRPMERREYPIYPIVNSYEHCNANPLPGMY